MPIPLVPILDFGSDLSAPLLCTQSKLEDKVVVSTARTDRGSEVEEQHNRQEGRGFMMDGKLPIQYSLQMIISILLQTNKYFVDCFGLFLMIATT